MRKKYNYAATGERHQ